MLEYTHEFAADFGLSLFKVEENLLKIRRQSGYLLRTMVL